VKKTLIWSTHQNQTTSIPYENNAIAINE